MKKEMYTIQIKEYTGYGIDDTDYYFGESDYVFFEKEEDAQEFCDRENEAFIERYREEHFKSEYARRRNLERTYKSKLIQSYIHSTPRPTDFEFNEKPFDENQRFHTYEGWLSIEKVTVEIR